MRRRHFVTELHANGKVVASRETFGWNNGIKAGEALVRERARSEGRPYVGAKADVYGGVGQPGAVYTREWSPEDGSTTVRVRMTEVFS